MTKKLQRLSHIFSYFQKKIETDLNTFLTKNKAEVMRKLDEQGIGVRTIFSGNILKHPAYKNIDCKVVGDLKNSNRLFEESVFVGVGPHLTKKDMLYIAKALKKLL